MLSAFKADTDSDLGDMADQITGATGAFVLLGEAKPATDVSVVNFADIPQTYAHLLLIGSTRVTLPAAVSYVEGRFNQDATAAYISHHIQGQNASVTGAATLAATKAMMGVAPGATAPAGYFGSVALWVAELCRRRPQNVAGAQLRQPRRRRGAALPAFRRGLLGPGPGDQPPGAGKRCRRGFAPVAVRDQGERMTEKLEIGCSKGTEKTVELTKKELAQQKADRQATEAAQADQLRADRDALQQALRDLPDPPE